MRKELGVIKEKTEDPHLWDQQEVAQKLLKKQSNLEDTINGFSALEKEFNTAKEFIDLAKDDPALQNELKQSITKLHASASDLEIACLFSGEADNNDCFLEIHAGAGGTESHDWAEMLYRMYLRFVEKQNFKATVISELSGEEAGIKSITIRISGHQAFGWLKTESGVHRLVRISPFNAAGKRQTSFASVWVYPVVDDKIEIEISESDLRIDTYRASGAGGQHINTTDSAVRITHLPSKIVVQCQNNRSQHRNKAEALDMLRAKLYELRLQEEEERLQKENSKKTDNSWGNQIRSYVLHPYRMVKDHRSNFETSDTDEVLDGNLKNIVFASLVYNAQNKVRGT